MLSNLKGVGAVTLAKLVADVDLSTWDLDSLAKGNIRVRKALDTPGAWELAESKAQEQLDAARRCNAKIISKFDADYPELMRMVPDAPMFIFVQGAITSNPEKVLSVIGTRTPSPHGREIAQRVSRHFAAQGWSVISGLAIGCDTVAHEAAIEAGGYTVAVLAHGLHTIAPKQNRQLADRILDSGGALVTEYAFGVEPMPHQFVQRDRIQAALAHGVILIQSDLEGGSLHASRAAIRYGRTLAVPLPTKVDLLNKEPKVAANLVLSSQETGDKLRLLNCEPADLERLFILRGREDYAELSDRLSERKAEY